jgi:fucose 4-O-acetylase-like acetyltransferase
MCNNGVLWFLACLFVTEILLFLVLKIENNKIRLSIFVFSAIIGYFFSLLKTTPPPFSSGTALVALLFTGTGYLSKNLIFNKMTEVKKLHAVIISIILFVLVYFISLNNGRIAMVYMDYKNPIIFLITSFIGLFACLLFSYSINKNFIIQFFGVNTIMFVGLSEPIKRAILGVFSKLLNYPMDDLRLSFMLTLSVSLVCFILFIPIIFVFNKYLYVLIGKKR